MRFCSGSVNSVGYRTRVRLGWPLRASARRCAFLLWRLMRISDCSVFILALVDDLHPHLAPGALWSAFQDAHHRRFILATRAGNLLGPLVRVHVAGLPADVRFVRFTCPESLFPGPMPSENRIR